MCLCIGLLICFQLGDVSASAKRAYRPFLYVNVTYTQNINNKKIDIEN
jgi:hypothetical protein